MNAAHVVVVRPGALGDSILTLPVLHALRLSGVSKITVLGTPASWGFLNPGAPGLSIRDFASSECLGLFTEFGTLGPALRKQIAGADLAIVYLAGENETVAAALKTAGVAQVRCIEPPRGDGDPDDANPVHASRQLLGPLRTLLGEAACDGALEIVDAESDPFIGPLDGVFPQRGFIAIHPGSGGIRKCWPVARYAELAGELSRLGNQPVVLFGPADDAVRAKFAAEASPETVSQIVECVSLREMLNLLNRARLYIGNDSGLTHLAARACATVAIFGPTDPSVWAPIGKDVRILKAPGGILENLSVADVLQHWQSLNLELNA